jgi:hypothetical protein
MTIWTIYNHGTNASSLKAPDSHEIVNLFGNNDRRPQFQGKIINEGVGSIGDPHKIANQFRRDAQGNYFVAPEKDGKSWGITRGLKGATGDGVHDNVDNTVEVIRALNLAGNKPDAINMIGWSRGAVTCIRMAYKLYQSQDANIRNIPINIFAVDPVAGAGHSTETDATHLTPNVRNYFATLAMGETRRFFKPIAGQRLVVQNPGVTKTWVLPMPGHHSDTAKNDNNTGKIVFNLAYRFLAAAGTPVQAMRHYMLNDQDTWKLYEALILGQSKVHKTGFLSKTLMGGAAYSRTDEGKSHSFGEDFFPNIHARLVMKMAYPITYDAYFGGGNIRTRNTETWARQFTAKIVAEQRLGGMAAEMNRVLEGLKPTTDGGPALPANVMLMINALNLIG